MTHTVLFLQSCFTRRWVPNHIEGMVSLSGTVVCLFVPCVYVLCLGYYPYITPDWFNNFKLSLNFALFSTIPERGGFQKCLTPLHYHLDGEYKSNTIHVWVFLTLGNCHVVETITQHRSGWFLLATKAFAQTEDEVCREISGIWIPL